MREDQPQNRVNRVRYYARLADVLPQKSIAFIQQNGAANGDVIISRIENLLLRQNRSLHQDEILRILEPMVPLLPSITEIYNDATAHILNGWEENPSQPMTLKALHQRMERAIDEVSRALEVRHPALEISSRQLVQDAYHWQMRNLSNAIKTFIVDDKKAATNAGR